MTGAPSRPPAPCSGKVLVERDRGVMTITISRPEVRNAIDAETARGLAAALDELDPDPGLVAAVLTGAGGTFCAGMDLRAFLAGERPSTEGRGFAGIVERGPPSGPGSVHRWPFGSMTPR